MSSVWEQELRRRGGGSSWEEDPCDRLCKSCKDDPYGTGESIVGVLWALCISICLIVAICFCFIGGVGHLNDSSGYKTFIDKSALTECELVSYNASVCSNTTSEGTGVSNLTVFGYEYVYESIAYNLCGNESLFSHPDELECGAGNSSLKQLNSTFMCTIEDCAYGHFYFGNELECGAGNSSLKQ